MTTLRASLLLPLTLLVPLAACGGGDDDDGMPAIDATPGQPDANPGVLIEVACDDTIASVYADPGALPGQNAQIVKCARDVDISKAELTARLTGDLWNGAPLTSGVHTYRILYTTQRGDAAGSQGTSSALLVLPDTPRAANLPILVASHGSRGQAAICAPSKQDPSVAWVNPDFDNLVYGLAGYGFAVIAPDLPGYANYGAAGNPPSAYASAADAAPATLDAARVMGQLVPTATSDQVVLAGFSQGGHTTLAALAAWQTYAPELDIVAVAAYAPLWLPQRTWGAILAIAGAFPFSSAPGFDAASIWYHYTHAELLDGPGAGLSMFRPEKQAEVQAFVDNDCWTDTAWATLPMRFGNDLTDVFDPAFTDAVSNTAAVGDPCPSDPTQNALCTKWMAIYQSDRPHLTGPAAQVPIHMFWGAKDQTIAYDRITCAIDRLKADMVNLTICVDPETDHSGTMAAHADYMADWIASKALGEPAPAACAHDETAIVDGAGAMATCATAPPND